MLFEALGATVTLVVVSYGLAAVVAIAGDGKRAHADGPLLRVTGGSSHHSTSSQTISMRAPPASILTRAWTVRRGSKAPQAAGAIHTDFERGFIRAETIAFPDYITCKGEVGAKEAGKMRQEGKEYTTQDGDIMLFRFNV